MPEMSALNCRRGNTRERIENGWKSVKCTGTGERATALVARFGVDGGRENTSGVLNEGA